MINIAIFASGGGSNALKIIEHFEAHSTIKIKLVVSNKVDAGVLNIASQHNINSIVINKKQLNDEQYFLSILHDEKIDFIVLAGFLLLIPSYLINHFPNKITNIHPSLLPKYGGKGMHGMHVHEAVVAAKENFSGATIHLIDSEYDKGTILYQAKVVIAKNDNPADVARKVLEQEHKYYGKVVEEYVESIFSDIN